MSQVSMYEWLGPFYFSSLIHPWFLVLLVGVGALLIAEIAVRAPGVIQVSTGDVLARVAGPHREKLRLIPPILRAIGLGLLVVALARPVKGLQPVPEKVEVMDLMLSLDVSGSMKALDFSVEGQRRDRLEVSKEVLRHFVDSRQHMTSQGSIDRLGLILFAGTAWTASPLTLDYDIVQREIDRAYIDLEDRRKQGTAIGSAIGLAVSRLRHSEAETRVLVLLTDGRNNTGELDPMTAAHLANEYGIRIYAVGAGSRGEVLIPQRTVLGERLAPVHIPIDDESLTAIAELTGGRYYRATDAESLREAYEEISELERTEIEISEYYHTEEGFPPYAAAGLTMVAASVFTRRLWFEPIP
ncbi:MAG: vWA domain-containing protein [Candidatus Hydrogenedentota bacterium]